MSIQSGFLLVNKPIGPTSHDIVDTLRRITGIRKIGHAGTLDPFASGLLIMAIGREATREISKFVKLEKVYTAKLYLGATSNTYDNTGTIISSSNHKIIKSQQVISTVLKEFEGKQNQIPPMFSAKKIKGKKLYELAREGKEIKREPVKINIEYIKMIDYDYPNLTIEVKVSSGTYIRSLANDIGQKLQVGAYLDALERIEIGEYKLSNAVNLKDITQDNWQKYLI